MASEILVIPEEMRERASKIRACGDADRATMRRLNNLVMTLTVAWDSPSQVAFVEKYMSMQPMVEKFHQAIEEFAILMDEHVTRMESTDNDLAFRINRGAMPINAASQLPPILPGHIGCR